MFFWKIGSKLCPLIDVSHIESCTPQIDLSNELLSASNRDRMPNLRPREVETLIYPNGTHSFGASSARVRFLDVSVFPLLLNKNRPSSLIVTQFRGMWPQHLSSEISLTTP